MIDFIKGAKRPHRHIWLSKEAKHDITVWARFLDEFNGRAFFLNQKRETSYSMKLFTDADGSTEGYGAMFGDHWFYGAWPDPWKSFNIYIAF